MAKPQEKLAESLEILEELQKQGKAAIRSRDLSRTHRERLLKNGFLQEVMKGWLIPSRPDEERGESTAWYASFWDFCAEYLNERFGTTWSLSPEQSIFLIGGNRTVPRQLLVRSPKARNKVTQLVHGSSIFESRAAVPGKNLTQILYGLRLFSLPAALVACGQGLFRQNATEARTALSMINNVSEILTILLEGGQSVVAGRLAGGFRNIGRDKLADEIIKTMRAAGYDVRENDPFADKINLNLATLNVSPYIARLKLMWSKMRESMEEIFPDSPGLPKNKNSYLKSIDDIYVTDAYHSLSIEGYRVSRDLIERVRSGEWNPDNDHNDSQRRDAMAARGYFEAFQTVKKSVASILEGNNPGQVVDDHHSDWYRHLFAPSVAAGIIKPSDLAGYRNDQVFIRRSKHVPPHKDVVRELMPEMFELLKNETNSAARVVLGHFVFVYIHPYMDGNGRMGRFLMNVMFASGGYPWTVIPVESRDEYMAALESASVDQDIEPFAKYLANLVSAGIKGRPDAKIPV